MLVVQLASGSFQISYPAMFVVLVAFTRAEIIVLIFDSQSGQLTQL